MVICNRRCKVGLIAGLRKTRKVQQQQTYSTHCSHAFPSDHPPPGFTFRATALKGFARIRMMYWRLVAALLLPALKSSLGVTQAHK